MEVKNYLKEEFLAAWKEASGRDFFGPLDLIEKHFNIPAVYEDVNRKINISENRMFSERYQRVTLRNVTKLFSDYLYESSVRGRYINENAIITAKKNLKAGGCEIHPC
jgi:hypothetical protein